MVSCKCGSTHVKFKVNRLLEFSRDKQCVFVRAICSDCGNKLVRKYRSSVVFK